MPLSARSGGSLTLSYIRRECQGVLNENRTLFMRDVLDLTLMLLSHVYVCRLQIRIANVSGNRISTLISPTCRIFSGIVSLISTSTRTLHYNILKAKRYTIILLFR